VSTRTRERARAPRWVGRLARNSGGVLLAERLFALIPLLLAFLGLAQLCFGAVTELALQRSATTARVSHLFHRLMRTTPSGRLHPQRADAGRRRGVASLETRASRLAGVVGSRRRHSGIAARVATGAARVAPAVSPARARRVPAIRALPTLRQLRYAAVTCDTAAASAFVVSWSEWRLKFRELFPARTDTSDTDLAGVPRPAWTLRAIAVQPKAAAPSLHMYRSTTLLLTDVFALYRAQLPAPGVEMLMRNHAWMVARSGDHTRRLSMRDDPATKQGVATLAVQSA